MLKRNFPTVCLIPFFVSTCIPVLSAACASRNLIAHNSNKLLSGPAIGRVNINRDDAAALARLPHVGPILAEKIVEHRDRYGSFRKAEHLLIVEGVSEKRFREIEHLITVD